MSSVLPGTAFTVVAPESERSPLRSDVAGFVGRTRRGPVDRLVRVEGWRAFVAIFGDVHPDWHLPWAVRGYFANGGQVAHVHRVLPADEPTFHDHWDLLGMDGAPPEILAAIAGDVQAGTGSPMATAYGIRATSPGRWIHDTQVHLRYARWGRLGRPEVDLEIRVPGELPEHIQGVPPGQLVEAVATRSRFLRLEVVDHVVGGSSPGPSSWSWSRVLQAPAAGAEPPGLPGYRTALGRLRDEPEIALVCLPDAVGDVPDAAERLALLDDELNLADAALDRMLVLDPPPLSPDPRSDATAALVAYAELVRDTSQRASRSAALYGPWILVPDPTGGVRRPLRAVPPSGHVAGLISRLDRERGAHHTPANARLDEAVGFEHEPNPEERLRLHQAAVNGIRCHPRDGLVVFGGRTLWNQPDDGGFVAHRRLLHRLVRAIRRTAAPLVFESNGPELWLALGRAIGTVLLSAFRSGALKGTRPEQAFRIKCDHETNPPEAIDLGQCVCEVAVAPAVPMEFIELRIHLSRDGSLEVLTP